MLVRSFDVSIPCSESVRESYIKGMVHAAENGRIKTIPNGCSLYNKRITPKDKKESRKLLGLPEDAIILSHIGSFRGLSLESEIKGHDILLKSFSSALASGKNLYLVCAGDGNLRGEAETLALQLGVKNRVFFLGNIAEPWPLLIASDIFVFPSRHEGLSLALLEAGSTGIPIIASDIPENRSIYEGDGWIFCPNGDVDAFSEAVIRVCSLVENNSILFDKAASFINNNYSIEACAFKYMKLFKEELKQT